MDTPKPYFMSQIAASSEVISSIEEHNAANSAVHLYPVSGTHGLSYAPGNPMINSASVSSESDQKSHVADPFSATDPSSFLLGAGAGLMNHGSSIETPFSLANDPKGLNSAEAALEASSLDESSHREDPGEAGIGQGLATVEELGFVENLSHWLEERLGSSVVSQWGVAPGSKRLANLWDELAGGESSLQDGRPPKRITNVACVKIKNDTGDVLVEAYQEMSDGRRRERKRPLAEKMKPGEGVEEACLRGIHEELGPELGASERVEMVPDSYRRREEERDSISYPGLPTLFIMHSMDAHIQQLPSCTEFATDEDESDHGRGSAVNGDAAQHRVVGVKRHFWRWVPESDLAEFCNR